MTPPPTPGRLARVDAWLRARPLVGDTVIAGLVAVYPMLLLIGTGEWQFAAQMLVVAPLVLRRVAPVTSFAAVSLLLLGQLLVYDAPRYGNVALMFALYAIAAYGPTWARRAGLATGLLGAVLASLDWYGNTSTLLQENLLPLAASVLVAWLLGAYMRTRRSYVAGLEERAVQLERDAAQQAQLAAAAERARIAREMHDVVAHSLSTIVVQADGAMYASQTQPGAARETLGTISSTGRRSLSEMRRLLGLLRDSAMAGDDSTHGEAGERGGPGPAAPAPHASDLPELVEQVRASGLRVAATTHGDLARVGSGTGLTVYRIVQEALTNILKHGGSDVHAEVDVTLGEDDVVVQVDDNGRGGAAVDDGDGHGISGIRERIAVHAGTVDAGPRPGGGFRVRAVLPYEREDER